jgi:hypothetical protein
MYAQLLHDERQNPDSRFPQISLRGTSSSCHLIFRSKPVSLQESRDAPGWRTSDGMKRRQRYLGLGSGGRGNDEGGAGGGGGFRGICDAEISICSSSTFRLRPPLRPSSLQIKPGRNFYSSTIIASSQLPSSPAHPNPRSPTHSSTPFIPVGPPAFSSRLFHLTWKFR